MATISIKREYQKQYRLRNRERLLAYGRRYVKVHAVENRERAKAWALANPERVRENKRLYCLENKAVINLRNRLWYKTPKGKESRLRYIRLSRIHHGSYGGVVKVCPRCGTRGYKLFVERVNVFTGHSEFTTYTSHHHVEYIGGVKKTVHDRTCYIGMGKL